MWLIDDQLIPGNKPQPTKTHWSLKKWMTFWYTTFSNGYSSNTDVIISFEFCWSLILGGNWHEALLQVIPCSMLLNRQQAFIWISDEPWQPIQHCWHPVQWNCYSECFIAQATSNSALYDLFAVCSTEEWIDPWNEMLCYAQTMYLMEGKSLPLQHMLF